MSAAVASEGFTFALSMFQKMEMFYYEKSQLSFFLKEIPVFWISKMRKKQILHLIWAASSEFVSSSIPSWKILAAHAQPFRGARDLAFCLKVPLDSLLVWASSGGSAETARMRRLAWTFAARIGDKYQIRLTQSILFKIKQSEYSRRVKVWF